VKPIKVKYDVLKKMEEIFKEGEFGMLMFDCCKNTVLKMLVLDLVPKFLKKLRKNEENEKNGRRMSLDLERVGRSEKRMKDKNKAIKRGMSEGRKHRSRVRNEKKSGRKTRNISRSVDSLRKKKLENSDKGDGIRRAFSGGNKVKKYKKTKSVGNIKKKEKKMIENILPLHFEEAYKDDEIKSEFYDYLLKTYSNEYLDFYEEVICFQNTLFEDEKDIKKAIEKICHKYLGIGEGSSYIISINFEVLDDLKDRLEKNINTNTFSLILSESKTILKSQYHNYISERNRMK